MSEQLGIESGYFQELPLREAAARYEALTDALPIGIALVDADGELLFGNNKVEELLGMFQEKSNEDPFNVHRWDIISESGQPFDEGDSPFVELKAENGGPSDRIIGIERTDEDPIWLSVQGVDEFDNGSSSTVMLTFKDVTERVEQRRRYERRAKQQASVARLGQLGLETEDLDSFMGEVCRTVAGMLDTEFCKVLELDASAKELFLREGVGWDDGIVGAATVASDENSQAGYTLLSEEPVIVEDLEAETRFSGPELLTSHGVVSGISTIIGSTDDPWGILGAHDRARRTFSEEDVHFVQAVANVLATTIEQWQHQRSLAALNQLNDTIRDVALTASELRTPREIERRLCERLIETDPYAFAWIGTVERGDCTVTPTASAGIDSKYLDEIEISIDETPNGQGPTGTAIRTGEPQFLQDIMNDPTYEPWREAAETYGYRSSAAIPIEYEGATYGVLNIYATEPFAFDGPHAETLSDLGGLIGHAIHTITQRKALISDTVTELEFRVEIPDHPILEMTAGNEVSITLERRIPLDSSGYIQFITVEGMDREALEDAIGRSENVESIEYITEREGTILAELTVSKFPISDALAKLGGKVPKVVATDGTFHVFVEISTKTDIREVVDSLQELYPSTVLLAQRTTARRGQTRSGLHRILKDELTDRQWRVLETAYFAGYFEWPRVKSGTEVAEILDISSPTFSEHIRTAEQTIIETLFDDRVE